jgi:tetratricopeptide (TPR) repeat protein
MILTRITDAYTKARELSPNDTTLQLPFAYLATVIGDSEGALKIVEDSIKEFPTTDAYLWMYQKDAAAKDYAAAEKDLINILNIDNYNATVLSELGMLYFVQDKFSNAIPVFIQSLAVNRSQPIIFAYLGVSYEKIGKTDEATKIFDFLKKQLPNQAQQLIDQARKQNQPTPAPVVENAPVKK